MASNLDLGKEIGPLPLGAWIAVVAGGLGIALWSRNNGANPATDFVVEDTSTPDDVADGTVGGWTNTSPQNDIPAATITTNEEWANAAINYLIAQGYNPTWAYSAITKAMAGGRGENKMSVREYALWLVALRKYGAPPLALTVPPPGAIPAPTKPPAKTVTKPHAFVPRGNGSPWCKVCGHNKNASIHKGGGGRPVAQPGTFKYAVVKPAPLPGSTLQSLAKIHYHDASKWHRIFEANRKGKRRADGTAGLIENPNRLHAGWRLIIPR